MDRNNLGLHNINIFYLQGYFIGEEIPIDSPRAGKFLQGPNQWPETLPREEFRDPLLEYRHQMVNLAELILRLLGLALPEKHSSANFFDQFMVDPSGNLRLLHYPPQTSTDEMQLGGKIFIPDQPLHYVLLA